MTRPRLAVCNATHGDEHTGRNFRRELDADVTEFHLVEGEFPDAVAFDGAVVTGSRTSVYWDEDWITETRAWARDAVDRGLPCLGICWGHQLLADVLGGRVDAMDAYELGYRTVERRSDSRLLAGVDDEFTAFTTHSDEVVELPPGAELLAENDRSIHAFRKGRVYGVQFHPEYDQRTARDVTEGKEGEAEPDRIAAALESIDRERYEAACEAKAVFDNFVSIVEDAREDGTVEASAD